MSLNPIDPEYVTAGQCLNKHPTGAWVCTRAKRHITPHVASFGYGNRHGRRCGVDKRGNRDEWPNLEAAAPAPTTAKQLLNIVDTFLATANKTEAQLAWDVLTALRSNDSPAANEMSDKSTTTIPIRRAALPLCASKHDKGWWEIDGTFGWKESSYTRPAVMGFNHFVEHVDKAVSALAQIGQPVKVYEPRFHIEAKDYTIAELRHELAQCEASAAAKK